MQLPTGEDIPKNQSKVSKPSKEELIFKHQTRLKLGEKCEDNLTIKSEMYKTNLRIVFFKNIDRMKNKISFQSDITSDQTLFSTTKAIVIGQKILNNISDNILENVSKYFKSDV